MLPPPHFRTSGKISALSGRSGESFSAPRVCAAPHVGTSWESGVAGLAADTLRPCPVVARTIRRSGRDRAPGGFLMLLQQPPSAANPQHLFHEQETPGLKVPGVWRAELDRIIQQGSACRRTDGSHEGGALLPRSYRSGSGSGGGEVPANNAPRAAARMAPPPRSGRNTSNSSERPVTI